MFGVDYSYSRPPIAGLTTAGVKFVCRYLTQVNTATKGKLLTSDEALALSKAGIMVVSNFEWTDTRATEGFAAGAADGALAAQQHTDAGGPADRPIYFSVDKDVLVGAVTAYFQGLTSVLPLSRVGVYGSYGICKDLLNAKLVSWTWQTYAWSGGLWEPRRNIEQYRNSQVLAGADVDFNNSITADFGGWLHRSLTGGTVTNLERVAGNADQYLYQFLGLFADKASGIVNGEGKAGPVANGLKAFLVQLAADQKAIADKLENLAPAELDYDKLARALLKAAATQS